MGGLWGDLINVFKHPRHRLEHGEHQKALLYCAGDGAQRLPSEAMGPPLETFKSHLGTLHWVGAGDFWRALPTSATLWFCVILSEWSQGNVVILDNVQSHILRWFPTRNGLSGHSCATVTLGSVSAGWSSSWQSSPEVMRAVPWFPPLTKGLVAALCVHLCMDGWPSSVPPCHVLQEGCSLGPLLTEGAKN